jgi:transketolase
MFSSDLEHRDYSETESLEQIARVVRGMILDQIVAFGNGHLASAFSSVEVLVALYFHVMKIDPQRPDWEERDRFILSKGHGCSALYAVLAHRGFFSKTILTQPQNGNLLGGHPDRRIPGVEIASGSLGHGLPIACGMALAAKRKGDSHRIFCLMGDGELQEGSVWEAAMFAAHHKLNNLTVIVDRNFHQSSGSTEEILSLDPLYRRWEAFKWATVEINGHSLSKLSDTLQVPHARPRAVIAYTEKGHGVGFLTNDMAFHTGIPSQEQVGQAKEELGL